MSRFFLLVIALALLAVACGTGEPASTAAVVPTTATTQAVSTDSVAEGTAATETDPGADESAVVADRGPSGVDGPIAPDFSLLLGDGATFTLSEEAKPVYMVFWAEW